MYSLPHFAAETIEALWSVEIFKSDVHGLFSMRHWCFSYRISVEGTSSFPACHQLGNMHSINMHQLSWFAMDTDFWQTILDDKPKSGQQVTADRKKYAIVVINIWIYLLMPGKLSFVIDKHDKDPWILQ